MDMILECDPEPPGQIEPGVSKELEGIFLRCLQKNPDLRFFATPWSPPGWMKTCDDIVGGHLYPRWYDAYARYFYRYDEAPLLIVNSERLNFVDNPEHFALLVERIGGMRGQREFFNLGHV